jgi:hypothetical protein
VRVPDDVSLAVTDPVVGRELWDTAFAAGGANPLEVLARHAELRDASSPGTRVLALAAALPPDRVRDWASQFGGALAISVDPRTIKRAVAGPGEGQHRCSSAMPWKWRQANAFTEEERLRVAARHMLMARNAGHLITRACLRVIDKFERQQPITDSDWADVDTEFMSALIRAESARAGVSFDTGPVNPEWAFKTMCAAEVVQCLRDYHTAEGSADLLYATRLVGGPLNPAAAVT